MYDISALLVFHGIPVVGEAGICQAADVAAPLEFSSPQGALEPLALDGLCRVQLRQSYSRPCSALQFRPFTGCILVVPHKAVAEVCKIGNHRRGWLLRIMDDRANPLMDGKVVGAPR